MSKLVFLICLIQVSEYATAYSQPAQYCLTVQELVDDRATKIAPYIELLIDDKRIKANQDGNIYFFSPGNNGYVKITMPNEKQYFIIGSSNFPLPADPKENISVLIRKPSNKEQAVSQFRKEANDLNIKMDELDSVKKYDQARYQQELHSLDSLYEMTTKKYQVSEADLRSATEKMQGRDNYFPIISSALEGYLNEAKDIRDIFKHMLAFSLENPRSFRLFDSTINVYNEAYNQLNNNNDAFEKAVLDYWDSKELSLGFHNVFDFAINNIHRASILPLNELLNQKVRDFIHEKNQRNRKNLKAEITMTLDGILPILDNSLTILESKVRYYTGELESLKNVYSQ